MSLTPYRGVRPRIASSAFVAPSADVVGDVEIGDRASIWFGAVLRGDVMPIRVGPGTSIQDNSVVHATGGWKETVVGADCTVGHSVILHGCTVADRVLVGMGSIVLDEAEIGEGDFFDWGHFNHAAPRARYTEALARRLQPLLDELERD